MGNKLVKNYVYILAYQFVTIMTPLFTTPYVSRVLGPKMIGTDAFIYSYVQLFMLIILLGLPTYASKKLAQSTSQVDEKTICSEVFSIQLILTLSIMIFYSLFIVLFGKYSLLFGLYSFTIISTGIDTSWYFVGKERISSIMIRNITVRLITVGCIFIFVNTSNDLWKFILINGCSLFLGQIVTGNIILKEIKEFSFTIIGLKQHIIPILTLFIVPCMTIVSLSISKILLGYWEGEIQVGMYNQAYKLYVMVISFISAITSVLLPTMAREFTQNRHSEVRRYLHFSIRLICATAIPVTIGILFVSNQFIPWFLGDDFSAVTPILNIISISFVVKGLSDIFGIQYLVVANKNKEYAYSIIVGAISSIIVCYLCLKLNYQALAPAIGLLVGILISLIVELIIARNAYSFFFLMKNIIKYSSFSILMGMCIYIFPKYIVGNRADLITMIVQILVGIISYLILLISSKDPLINIIKKRKE